MTPEPHVAIILVNWNNPADTEACLHSLSRLSGPPFTVVLVENGSTDHSLTRFRQLIPHLPYPVHLLPLSINRGFAHGNNAAIRLALRQNIPFLWLLNNDTEVEPHTLDHLVAAAHANPAAGMVGSRILFAGTNRIWYAGARVNRWTGRAHVVGFNQPDGPQFQRPGPTGYVTGCSLLVRAEVVRAIGLLPADYFLYYEETDWNMRAQRAGWISWYEPQSVVHHKVGRSTNRGVAHPPVLIYYNIRNRYVMMQRLGNPAQRITATLYLGYQLVAQLRQNLFRRTSIAVRLRYLALGFWHALIRRMGPAPPLRSQTPR